MKNTLTALLLILNLTVLAQGDSQQGQNPVILVTWQYERPNLQKDDTCFKNFDYIQFINWYVDKGIRPNQLIKNFRVLNHAWGEDSYKVFFIYEVDGFANIEKVDETITNLLNNSFKTETEKNLFWRRYNLIFDRHSDNILYDSVKPKM